jgi:hypothetical protein
VFYQAPSAAEAVQSLEVGVSHLEQPARGGAAANAGVDKRGARAKTLTVPASAAQATVVAQTHTKAKGRSLW